MNLQLVGGLEHEFYDYPYFGNSNPNWHSYFSEGRYTTNQIRNMAWVLGISDISQELWMIYGWLTIFWGLSSLGTSKPNYETWGNN
jgi:hypothetical protein